MDVCSLAEVKHSPGATHRLRAAPLGYLSLASISSWFRISLGLVSFLISAPSTRLGSLDLNFGLLLADDVMAFA